jgi:undecaprenyl-diphosphatase
MDLIQASILGLVQGLTEYLPVSSSAHLVLVPKILGWSFDPHHAFVFDVLVQLGTLLGVIAYFWKDLLEIAECMFAGLLKGKPVENPHARLGWLVGLATVPAAVLGILLKSEVRAYFDSPRAVLAFLIATAGALTLTELLTHAKRTEVRILDALVVGLAQVAALFPGVSRSGSTMSAGILMGLSKQTAAKFSFLMSIPIMLGASLEEFREMLLYPEVLSEMLWPVMVGMLVSAVSGYFVIKWFLGFLKTQSLLWFAAYCALVGGIGLIVL